MPPPAVAVSEAGTWAPTAVQIEGLLRYLRSPSRYLRSAVEKFTEAEHALLRTVDVEIDNFNEDEGARDPVLFVALTPKKLTDFNVVAKLSSGQQLRRLNHQDHILVSQRMILTRFYMLLDSIRASPQLELDKTVPNLPGPPIYEALTALLKLPEILTSEEGREELSVFFDANGKLRALEGWQVDFDQMSQFYKICKVLATRWLSIIEVPGNAATDRLSIQYQYSRPFHERYPNFLSRVRKFMGAPPFEFKIHLPLARSTPSYTCEISAPKGLHFKHSSVVTEDVSMRVLAGEHRAWGETADNQNERGMKPLEERRYADTSTDGSRSKIFVTNGHLQTNRLYLYLKMYEVPPGTLLHAGGMLTLQVLSFLWPLYFIIFRDDAIPNYSTILVALLTSMATLAVTYLHPFVETDRPSVAPRLIAIFQLALGVFFAFWVMLGPNRPRPKHVDGTTDVPLVMANTWFGLLMWAVFVFATAFIWNRLRRAYATHRSTTQMMNTRRNS
jgi:hypothetical protein